MWDDVTEFPHLARFLYHSFELPMGMPTTDTKQLEIQEAASPERRRPGWAKIHPWIPVALTLGFAAGCSAGRGTHEGDEQQIYGGVADTKSDAVLALRIQWAGRAELCSGTLIAQNLLLTARHCVSSQLTTDIGCDEDGHSTTGPQLGSDVSPTSIRVYSGATNQTQHEIARGARIFHPEGGTICNADIAILELDRDVTDIHPLPVRLKGGVSVREALRSVGFGQTDLGVPLGTRMSRSGVDVVAIGAGISESNTVLGSNEFEVGVSTCHGDSGGPAISETSGAVVGVVSRGGDCAENYGHVYTSTSGFASLFDLAFKHAGTTPLAEPEQAEGTSTPRMATSANSGEQAPTTQPPQTAASGCSVASRPSTFGAWILLAPLAIFLRRRKSQ